MKNHLGKIINFVTKLEDFDEMSQRASGHIKEQLTAHLNSSNQKDTIKLIQGELIKAECEIGVIDGIIGNKTERALLEVTHKLGIVIFRHIGKHTIVHDSSSQKD